jgi:hypothetical protein
MYEDDILSILAAAQKPLSIAEVREALMRRLKTYVSYEATKRSLLSLSTRGLIHSKSIGRGKRATWIFWSLKSGEQREAQAKAFKPFEVSAAERDSMTPEELIALYDSLVEEYGRLIMEALGRSSRYIVLCDGKIVYASNHEPSDEEIRNMERNLGKVCYVLTEDPIEESRWSPITDGDYYPTIDVFIGGINWGEEEVFHRGLKITSDFDTGNPDVAAFNNEDVNLIQPTTTYIMRRAFHLGRHYNYYLVTLKMGINDAKGIKRCITSIEEASYHGPK